MISRLPPALRGTITGTVLALNTLLLTLAMVPAAAVKFAIRATAVRRVCDRVLIALASTWVAINNAWIAAASPAPWDVRGIEGAEGLREDAWYLVSSNHRSWVDIVVLQRVLHGRVPFLKFFLKQELIWVPVIGWAWWALDFPFMKRGKGAGAQRSDLTAAREACEKFKQVPTSVINFLEGTRYSDAKRDEQGSPYRHLLKPKIGGLGIALATMGDMFESMIDVTIVYPHGTPTFADLLCGRVGTVHVRVSQVPIPAELISGDPIMDRAYRRRLTGWVDAQWVAKDALIDRLMLEDQKVQASAA
ncbi:MAG: acyltransferase [Burkholderiales bacterium]|nr:acyltransferase [Burkholderiales bacterium]